MHYFIISVKILVFIFCITVIFFGIHTSHLPFAELSSEMSTMGPLFSAISMFFSILSAFTIQSQWHKWDTLLDAARGEINMLRQLFIMANHFPARVRKQVRHDICNYLDILLVKTGASNSGGRSKEVDEAMNRLENTTFMLMEKYDRAGAAAFNLLSKASEYRELRLQNGSHSLPIPLRMFVFLVLGVLIVTAMMMSFYTVFLSYILTLIISFLAYGVYLIIDDLDHPFRPGNWHLSYSRYKELYMEIKAISGYKGTSFYIGKKRGRKKKLFKFFKYFRIQFLSSGLVYRVVNRLL